MNGSDRIWEESLIAYLNVITRHSSGQAEKNQKLFCQGDQSKGGVPIGYLVNTGHTAALTR